MSAPILPALLLLAAVLPGAAQTRDQAAKAVAQAKADAVEMERSAQRLGDKVEAMGKLMADMDATMKAMLKAARTQAGTGPSAQEELEKLDGKRKAMIMQFLALQEATQAETRKFQTLSNASKARHDLALNAIRNMK